MNIFEQAYLQLLNEDNEALQTEREELLYLKRVLNRYWDVDDQTIKQIDAIVNEKDEQNNFKRYRHAKVEAEPVIREAFDKNMDVVEYITDHNNTSHVAEYLNDVNKRLNIFSLTENGYIPIGKLIEALKGRDINVDLQTLQTICKICPTERGKGVGQGETLCKTLLNMTKSVKGDGALDGKDEEGSIVQIKGYQARLKGAQNYGNWGNVVKRFNEKSKKKLPPNITCRDFCNFIQENWQKLHITGQDLAFAFGGLLTNSVAYNKVKRRNCFINFINALLSNQKNEEVWKKTFLRTVLEYYRESEGWTYMILIDNEKGLKGLYISSDMADIMNHIKVLGWPNSKDDRASAIQIGYKESGAPTDQAKK